MKDKIKTRAGLLARKQTRLSYGKRLPDPVVYVTMFAKMYLVSSPTLHCICCFALNLDISLLNLMFIRIVDDNELQINIFECFHTVDDNTFCIKSFCRTTFQNM